MKRKIIVSIIVIIAVLIIGCGIVLATTDNTILHKFVNNVAQAMGMQQVFVTDNDYNNNVVQNNKTSDVKQDNQNNLEELLLNEMQIVNDSGYATKELTSEEEENLKSKITPFTLEQIEALDRLYESNYSIVNSYGRALITAKMMLHNQMSDTTINEALKNSKLMTDAIEQNNKAVQYVTEAIEKEEEKMKSLNQ